MFKWEEISYFKLKGNYKKWRIESQFQSELLWKMRWMWNICHHIADIWLWNKFLDLFFVTKKWLCLFIELKQIPWSTFNVKNFEEDQVILLREMDKRNPELARVWIFSVKHNTYKILTFSEIWRAQNEKGWVKIFNK